MSTHFEFFMKACDKVLMERIGLTSSDIADADWWTYWDSEYSAEEACAYALYDYNDMSIEMLEQIGLGGHI